MYKYVSFQKKHFYDTFKTVTTVLNYSFRTSASYKTFKKTITTLTDKQFKTKQRI